MNKAGKIIAYIMQQLSLIGENFGWQIGRVGANWKNGYMKSNQDCKAHFRKDEIKREIEKILEDHIVEVNKMIVTNADRIRNMSDEELADLLNSESCIAICGVKWCSDKVCGFDCINNWLKEKVE